MKALGVFIFSGSASLGVMNAGFEVSKILEISKEMITEGNAQHFSYNYPNIPLVEPEVWENDQYLESLSEENYDLVYGNPPCSGLSQINRNASCDNKVNGHIYRFTNVISKTKPKTFLMENAPTLISRGKPILDDIFTQLSKDYRITLIRDYAANHRVCMKRQRTMVIGWRKDIFSSIPHINHNKETVSVSNVLGLIPDDSDPMKMFVPTRTYQHLEYIIPDIPPNKSMTMTIISNLDKYIDSFNEKDKEQFSKLANRYSKGERLFDKSQFKLDETKLAPSLASVVQLIHPTLNRPLYVREYLRIMGYPDSYNLDLTNKTPIVQCIAQGVPVEFIKWITLEIKRNLDNPTSEFTDFDSDIHYYNFTGKYERFMTLEQFKENAL